MLKAIFSNTVGRKYIIAAAGLFFYLFVIGHLIGNLTLFSDNPSLFNNYSHKLISLGPLLLLVELILLALFLLHFILGTITALKNRNARDKNYVVLRSAGRTSKKSLSSTTMIYTGLVILVFTVLHLITFKYGPGIDAGYIINHDGTQIRDLHRLVVEVFQKEWVVIWYVAAMIFLGFHLRHAFWSALQSLGLSNPRLTPVFYGLGTVLAILLAAGYIIIPVWVYFRF
ncbi:MAG: succinate dehydrogenase cytochrome b subunit [Calditrichia bacterium]